MLQETRDGVRVEPAPAVEGPPEFRRCGTHRHNGPWPRWKRHDYGDGQSRGVKRKERQPKIRLGRAKVSGGLDMETVRRIINNKRRQFLFCYQQELQKNPSLAGKVKVKFKITARGKVTYAKISEDTIKNARVTSCIRKKMLGLVFPKAKRGGSTTVNYPFVFRGG